MPDQNNYKILYERAYEMNIALTAQAKIHGTTKASLEEDFRRIRDERDVAKMSALNWQDIANCVRLELIDALGNKPPCLECDGTGGTRIESETYSADRLEIADLIVTGHESPEEDPCDACHGTGKDLTQ